MACTFLNASKEIILQSHVPIALQGIELHQAFIPQLAKNVHQLAEIDAILPTLPTAHHFYRADATTMSFLQPASIHLVVTSPPYWTLKKYHERMGQLGDIEDYEFFLHQLDQVWTQCYDALVPGGRLICIVGDVCLSRRKNHGRHTVVPLHSAIQEVAR